MTMRPAGFLDRDGVLNVDVGYPHRPDQLRLTPTAGAGVRRLNAAGHLAIVVTNQSGVARGLFSLEDVDRFHQALQHRLAAFGARIDRFYVAPYHPAGVVPGFAIDHPDRKPGTGMLTRAFNELGVGRAGSFLIGDRSSDMEAARRAGIRGILVEADVCDLDATIATALRCPPTNPDGDGSPC